MECIEIDRSRVGRYAASIGYGNRYCSSETLSKIMENVVCIEIDPPSHLSNDDHVKFGSTRVDKLTT